VECIQCCKWNILVRHQDKGACSDQEDGVVKMKRIIVLILISTIAFGDKLYHKNGQILEGKFVIATDYNMVIFRHEGEEILIQKDYVIKVTDDNGLVIYDSVSHEKYLHDVKNREAKLGRSIGCALILIIIIYYIKYEWDPFKDWEMNWDL